MHNAPLRSEIETALDELVAYEEGMRFQSLAVVLAKRRWPELVASERKKDLGLDAYVPRDQASDGVGRGLACSITATYDKIAGDAKKVAEHLPAQIQHLVFATSGRVGTPKKLEWVDKIRKEFGYELEVMSREEIVSSLTDPQNVALCRTYLRIDVDIDVSLPEIAKTIRVAANEELVNWVRRIEGQPLIDLQANSVERSGVDRADVWSTADMATALGDARRLVLEGPAGCGKTTTLIQLARGTLSEKGVVFLVDLPLWVKSGRDILAFISRMAAFQRKGLTSLQLAQSESEVRFYFLLNGWNEVSEPFSADAALYLRDVERQFPAAGILVATRAHYVAPLLPGSTRLRLRRVGHRARSAYLRERLGENADAFLTSIKADPGLDELTRTPFVLSELTSIVAAGGPIPRTRASVIEAAVKLQEQSPEHALALRSAPVGGMSSAFLESLAMRMMPVGAVSLAEAEARTVVHGVSERLAADGQLLPRPTPADILNTLCGHHVLERFEYPESGHRFAHQLFEEYYAFRGVKQRFAEAASGTGESKRTDFARDFLNEPAWTEPVEMLAESLNVGHQEIAPLEKDLDAAAALVMMALSVDPVFACHLCRVLGQQSIRPIAQTLSRRLREWYSSTDEHHRNCALAGMLASGMDTFRDVLEPLLSSDDDQLRLRTYRLWPDVSPLVLGADWETIVRGWSEEARATFVSEILHHRFVPEVSRFALADLSPEVRAIAVDALRWIGAEDEYARALHALDDASLRRVFAGASGDVIPAELRPSALRLLRVSLEETTDPATRTRILLRMHRLGDSEAIADVRTVLQQIPDEKFRDLLEYTIAPALDALREDDPEWTTQWVGRRIADGRLWSDRWSKYLTVIPNDLREEQFARLATEDLEHRYDGPISIVARADGVDLVRRAFLRVLEVWEIILAAPRQPRPLEGAVLRQLEALLRAIPSSTVVSALSDFLSAPPTPEFARAFVHLYSSIGRTGAGIFDLDDRLKSLVRSYVKSSVALILEEEDFTGELKAELGSVVSQVGEPEDIEDLMQLIHSDLKRVSDGRAARVRGERTEAADGAVMSWTDWYVSAIVTLMRGSADDVLLTLFSEREYERSLLEEYARQFTGGNKSEVGRQANYDRIWHARARPSDVARNGSRRARVAEAIRKRIRQLEDTRGLDANEKFLNGRLKMLARALAAVAPREFADEIMGLLALPADFDTHTCVDALERLLYSGVMLPADKCLPLLDAALARMKRWGIQDQDRWVIVRFLCICPFVDDPGAGIEKIREIIQQARLHIYDLRDLLPALGHSRFEGALPFMLELVSKLEAWQAIEYEWISAFVTLETDNSIRAVLGLVDPELPGLPFALGWDATDRAAKRIAEIAAQDPIIDSRLRDLAHLSLDAPKRDLLAKTLAARGTLEAMLAALNLLDDKRQPPIPSGVRHGLEAAFIEERAHPTYANALTRRAAASNPLRAKLFFIVVADDLRKHSAYSLLGQIEEWRLEYGRPIDEPRHPDFGSGLPWPPPEPK